MQNFMLTRNWSTSPQKRVWQNSMKKDFRNRKAQNLHEDLPLTFLESCFQNLIKYSRFSVKFCVWYIFCVLPLKELAKFCIFTHSSIGLERPFLPTGIHKSLACFLLNFKSIKMKPSNVQHILSVTCRIFYSVRKFCNTFVQNSFAQWKVRSTSETFLLSFLRPLCNSLQKHFQRIKAVYSNPFKIYCYTYFKTFLAFTWDGKIMKKVEWYSNIIIIH
jgi:hypothetical protein